MGRGLSAWVDSKHPRDERGMFTVTDAPGDKLSLNETMINRVQRKREINRFRAEHGEATIEMPVAKPTWLKPGERISPYVTRKLWVSVDPTSKKWRVTYVDMKGPSGHSEYSSWTEAVRSAVFEFGGQLHKATKDQILESDTGKRKK